MLRQECWIPRKGVPVWIRHGIEVVQITEEFIEAMKCRQVFVQIAEMILAKLSRGVALRFERSCDRAGLCRHANFGTGLTNGRQSCAQGYFASDEGGPAGRTAGFRIVVSEQHALRSQLVEVGRLA